MIWTAIAVLFAFLWVFAFYREDRRREPLVYVALAFGFGMLAMGGASLLEAWVLTCPFLGQYEERLIPRVTLFVGMIGPIEEVCKFLPIWLLFYPRRFFDEAEDGLIYGAAVATGFAFAENLKFFHDGTWPVEIMLYRSPGGPFVHILFAAYWGTALGWATLEAARRDRRNIILAGLARAALMHGLFNLVTYSAKELTVQGVRGGMLGILIFSFLAIRWHLYRMKRETRVATKG